MIDRQELSDFARELSLSLHVVEKDYVLGWLLAGISAHEELARHWVFKGGTCLKKCYFETYRFSEDLDFTITDEAQLDEGFLLAAFRQIAAWIYEEAGIEFPADEIRFQLTHINGGGRYAEGRVYYVGPLQQRRNLARIKFDLTSKEKLVLAPEMRNVHHPYSDRPDAGIQVLSYCFEEVFAEKVRALAERERPRDLYDVVHLYRHEEIRPDRTLVMNTLSEKCAFKNIAVPSRASLLRPDAREKLLAEWQDMLAHQLPTLPSFEQFWDELPQVFDWLHAVTEKLVYPAMQIPEVIDHAWRPPAMVHAWRTGVPMESIRFAAANRLCVNLHYGNSWRLIEPYSLRKSREGNVLLYAVKRETGEVRGYRVDRMQGIEISTTPFTPRYPIELTPAGPFPVSGISPRSTAISGYTPPRRTPSVKPVAKIKAVSRGLGSISGGPSYIFKCGTCGKQFKRKSFDSSMNAHKNKQGYPCYGNFGTHVRTDY